MLAIGLLLVKAMLIVCVGSLAAAEQVGLLTLPIAGLELERVERRFPGLNKLFVLKLNTVGLT